MFKGIATVLLLVVSNAFMTLVRAYRLQIQTRTIRDTRHRPAELGNRAVRILLSGPGQPHRKRRIRRSVLDLGAESHSGGRVALGFHGLRAGFHEIRHAALEPPRGISMPDPGRLFHFPQIAPALQPSRRESAARPGGSSPQTIPTILSRAGVPPSPGRSGI